MSSDSDSWEFWLKLIFVLACSMVVIVGIALFANVWTNCRFRKQIRYDEERGKERGTVIVQPWIREASRGKEGEGEDEDGFKQEKLFGVEGVYTSKPAASNNTSPPRSEAHSSNRSTQSALLPPRPDLRGSRPALSVRTSVITTLPSPSSQHRSEALRRPPLPNPKGSKTSLSQFQEMPAEEAAYVPATTTVLSPYLRSPDAPVPQFTYTPYRGIDSTLNYPSIPPRASSQNQHELVSASSQYSQASLGLFSNFPSPHNDTTPFIPRLSEIADRSTNDSSSLITTIPAAAAAAPAQPYPRTLNPYHGPQLNAYAAHPLKSHPFVADCASSESYPPQPRPQISRFSSISPTTTSDHAQPSYHTGDALISYRPPLPKTEAPARPSAPLPILLPTRYSGPASCSGPSTAPRPVPARLSGPTPLEQGLVRDLSLGYGYGVDAYGMRRDPTYWTRARQQQQQQQQQQQKQQEQQKESDQEREQEQRSVVDTVRTGASRGTSVTGRMRRKLQKRRKSDDGQEKCGQWMNW